MLSIQQTRAAHNAVLMPIYFTETQVLDVPTWPDQKPENLLIDKEPFLNGLLPLLDYFYSQKIKVNWSEFSQLSIENLSKEELNPIYNENNLDIHLDIPLKMRRKVGINFFEQESSVNPNFEKAAVWSGFLNIYTNETANQNQSTNASRFDLVSNYQGFIFENKSVYNDDHIPNWQRIESHLTKDVGSGPLKHSRTALGDLNLSPKGFQSVHSFLGGSVRKEQSLHPQRMMASLSQREIMVTKPSRIEVYINNQIFSQFHIQPGKFNLNNLPISAGQNNIKVRLIDDLGQIEEFNIMYLFDSNILAAGEHEYFYGVGRTADSNLYGKSYLVDSTSGSFYHRYGWTSNYSLGINFQSLADQSMFGAEVLSLSDWGIFGFDLAASQGFVQNQIDGNALRLSYRSIDGVSLLKRPLYFSAQVEYRSLNFSQPLVSGYLPTGSQVQSLGQISFNPTE